MIIPTEGVKHRMFIFSLKDNTISYVRLTKYLSSRDISDAVDWESKEKLIVSQHMTNDNYLFFVPLNYLDFKYTTYIRKFKEPRSAKAKELIKSFREYMLFL